MFNASFTGRDDFQLRVVELYTKAVGLFRDYSLASEDPIFTQVVHLDLSTVVSSVSGPKRPHDRVSVSEFKEDFEKCLVNKVSMCLLELGLKTLTFLYIM